MSIIFNEEIKILTQDFQSELGQLYNHLLEGIEHHIQIKMDGDSNDNKFMLIQKIPLSSREVVCPFQNHDHE